VKCRPRGQASFDCLRQLAPPVRQRALNEQLDLLQVGVESKIAAEIDRRRSQQSDRRGLG
jgi:hypothetical protein